MLNLNHKNLDVWKISVELVADIYELTEKFPKTEIFGLSNQLRRASVSITSNIGGVRQDQLCRTGKNFIILPDHHWLKLILSLK